MYKNYTNKLVLPKWHVNKLLLIMRLTTVILIVTVLQVSANGSAQTMSFKKSNSTYKEVFAEIKSQLGYNVVWLANKFDAKRVIDVNIKNAPLEKVLDQTLAGENVSYSIKNKTVVLKTEEEKASIIDRIGTYFKQIVVNGKVVDEKGNGLPGATVRLKDGKTVVSTNLNGDFRISVPYVNSVLTISYTGYTTKEVTVINDNSVKLLISLIPAVNSLEKVEIVSTGYQSVPKERVTGSFEKVDNTLFNRTVTTDVLSRLEGVTNDVLFNKTLGSKSPIQQISIRGISSLTGFNSPLIVLDNFPYEGDINNINPNDVESITILKDAAAASIWGTKAGNGVIVINTKKGKYDNPLQISLNSNLTITNKPDLYYLPLIKTNDFIDVEQFLFSKGKFNSSVDDMFSVITPVVQILDKQKKGTISPTDAQNQINTLRSIDSRNDFLKYIYRDAVNQQYALNINGGNKQVNYFLSGGYDKNLNSLITSDYSRISMRSAINFKPIKNLEIQTSILYTETKSKDISAKNPIDFGVLGNYVPYTRLTDDNGNPAEVDISPIIYLNRNFRDNPGSNALLDYQYRPLAELNESTNTVKLREVLINLGANYKITPIIGLSLKYQYQKNSGQTNDWSGIGSYYTRDYINYFSNWSGTSVIRGVPVGDILYTNNQQLNAYAGRAQLDLNKVWNDNHEITALAGVEIRENNNRAQSNMVYGYNNDILTTQTVDYVHPQTVLNGNDSPAKIPDGIVFRNLTDRYTSIFANAAYTYKKRYIVSASARKDATNFFGVNSNRRGQPLWSTGLSWILSKEDFYKSDLVTFLKLRATYGYNGNAVNNVSALTVINYSTIPNPITGLIYGAIKNPPNPDLKWEQVRVINLGADFSSLNNRLSGSIEYFNKHSSDLITIVPINPTIGFPNAPLNSGEIHGKGLDINLISKNLVTNNFNWTSNFLFTYNRNVLSKYPLPLASLSSLINSGTGASLRLVEGRDPYGIYAYKFAGLDPANGDPRGYLNGQISKNYSALVNPTNVNDLDYLGSALPVYYGAFRNSFSWKSFTLSANILYKLGYKFQRAALNYTNLFNSAFASPGSAEFSNRWQNPGDENITNVPSMVYPSNSLRDKFYYSSSATIDNAAHVRLQDINLSYNLIKPTNYIRNIKFSVNLRNVGIIWRANKDGLDPDYGSTLYPNPRSITFGLNADF